MDLNEYMNSWQAMYMQYICCASSVLALIVFSHIRIKIFIVHPMKNVLPCAILHHRKWQNHRQNYRDGQGKVNSQGKGARIGEVDNDKKI